MNLLSSILPGLRAFRAPFAAGVITLLAGWIAFEPHVHHLDSATGIYGSLSDLEDLIGRGGETAALAFTAYLLGSLVVTLMEATSRRTLRAGAFRRLLPGEFQVNAAKVIAQIPDPMERTRLAERLHALYAPPRRLRIWKDARVQALQQEWRMIQFQLLVKQPVLAAEIDRIESEAEFRRALVIPLALLAAAIGVSGGRWWIVALLVLLDVLVLRASIFATLDAEHATADLLLSDVVQLPLIDALERGSGQRLPQ
jgi:hypothetical protein